MAAVAAVVVAVVPRGQLQFELLVWDMAGREREKGGEKTEKEMGTFFSRQGVEEEPEERVGEVVLTLKGLRDIPDSSLNGRVRSLVLDFNPISRVSEPERLLVLTSLTELSLGICGLEEFPPSISQLCTLEKLSLSGNKLSIIPEGSLDSLSSLTELRLDSNALTVLPRISHLSRLKMLSADMNPIGDAVLSQLPRSLEVVRLSLCGITGAAGSLVPISLLHELRELDLSENTIANVPQQWSSLNKLQRLLLQRNRISGFDVAIIEGMTSLRRLDLGYNEVLEDVMRLPGHSKSLMWFCVSGNAFTDQRNRPPSAPPLVAPATSQECQVTAEFALPDEILPHIFLGSVECAWNKFGLRSLGVTHVLTVATYSPLYPDV